MKHAFSEYWPPGCATSNPFFGQSFSFIVQSLYCHESKPGVPPSHHQRSPSPFLLDSFPSFHTPVTKHILSCSPFAVLIFPPHSPPCLARLHVCCICICVVYFSTLWSMLLRTPALRCIQWCPILFSFCLYYNSCLPAFGPRPLFFLCLSPVPWHVYLAASVWDGYYITVQTAITIYDKMTAIQKSISCSLPSVLKKKTRTYRPVMYKIQNQQFNVKINQYTWIYVNKKTKDATQIQPISYKCN